MFKTLLHRAILPPLIGDLINTSNFQLPTCDLRFVTCDFQLALSEQEPERTLYLAVPIDAYSSFFTIRLVQNIIRIHQLKLIVYNPETEEIVEWIN
ncbi:hypothetical protein LC612_37670 [Nostoc sp. CHAB 5834]|nr:hypothetical protein [Nostoc sp. CHAB 5834]